MKWRTRFRRIFYGAAALWLPLPYLAADFLKVDAELETVNWSWRGEDDPPTAKTFSTRVLCVVGTNSWLITTATEGMSEESWWYTGTNVVWRFETPNPWERRKVSH